ncbi:MAG: TraR/DksA C4-type zinc finger protein [bacterium]|nr:TraR/DksA C4-type zinc finger protein [bacterium]
MEPNKIGEFQKLLLAEKRLLESELSAFAARDPKMKGDWDTRFPERNERGASSSHSAQDEQADLREEFESKLAQEQSLETRLLAVREAFERIEKQTYGRCLTCGEEIPEERLRANPAAAYDMAHQPRE